MNFPMQTSIHITNTHSLAYTPLRLLKTYNVCFHFLYISISSLRIQRNIDGAINLNKVSYTLMTQPGWLLTGV